MNSREKDNLGCLKLLTSYLTRHSELRFIQALWALGVVDREDRFYEEPSVTLKRMQEMDNHHDK